VDLPCIMCAYEDLRPEERVLAVRFSHVDAFTEGPFAGNPAGVCLLPVAPSPCCPAI